MVAEVFRLVDAVPARYRVMILLASFTALRFWEPAGLQRWDVDLERRSISVRRSVAETRLDGLTVKAPKAAAEARTVAFPVPITLDLAVHLAEYAAGLRRAARGTAAAERLPADLAPRHRHGWPRGRPLPRSAAHSKIHLIVDRRGLPLLIGISAANLHDSQALIPLVCGIPLVRSRCGPQRRRPGKLRGHKGCDYRHLRRWLSSRGIRHRLARKGTESSRHLGRHRWVVERTVSWLSG